MALSHQEENNSIKNTQPRVAVSILDRWIIWVGKIASYFFMVSAIIIFWEIVARYVFDSPTFWVHETTTLICAILFAFGGSHCIATDKHIRIVLIYDIVSGRIRYWLDALITFLCIIYAAGMTWAGWLVVQPAIFTPTGEFRLETSGSSWDPPFPALTKMFLFLVLILMLIQFILHFVSGLRRRSSA